MVTQAVRTGIFLIPVDHDQEYKDSIRNLNGFLDMEKNDNFPWAEKSGRYWHPYQLQLHFVICTTIAFTQVENQKG